MSYSTVDDLMKLIPRDVLIQLTDDENTGAPVTARIEEAIGQADAEVNTYCAAKYMVPFVAVPDAAKKCSVDIAIYNLYSRRVEEIPATRSDRYKNAVRLLESIAKGTISIGVASSGEPPGNDHESAANTKTLDDRTFRRKSMGGF